MAMMTQPWLQIMAHYEDYKGEGLFGWPSMFDLCIVQIPVSYPFDGPQLRLSPISGDQIEFRYVDTLEKSKQWHRTVEADQAWARLIKFLDQLRWFQADVLESLSERPS